MITIRRNGAKSLGKWRKPERMLGTNREDGVKMLENTMKVQENVITTRGNGAKTIGKSRRRGGNKKEQPARFLCEAGVGSPEDENVGSTKYVYFCSNLQTCPLW